MHAWIKALFDYYCSIRLPMWIWGKLPGQSEMTYTASFQRGTCFLHIRYYNKQGDLMEFVGSGDLAPIRRLLTQTIKDEL